MDIFRMVNKVLIHTVLYSMIMIIQSCSYSGSSNSDSSNVTTVVYTDSINLDKSPKGKKTLPEGLAYGKIIPPSFPDSMKVENNLLSQVATYNSALMHGDVNTCSSFLYPDAFEYCRKYYPDFPDEEVIKEFFKDISGGLQEALKTWTKMGVEPQIVVTNIERKIVYKDDIIVVFNVSLNMCSDDVFIHSTDLDKTIGISHNKGKNWWFMNNHEDLPTILKKRYNQDVVNEVMGY